MKIPLSLHIGVANLQAAYVSCVDSGEFGNWPAFFTHDCHYRIVPRENHERGLPLATIDLKGMGMLRDRVYGIQSTLFHAPYYQRHILGPTRIVSREGNLVCTETNYLVVRTKRDATSDVFNVGRYIDRIQMTNGSLLFQQKICVFDSEIIPNSLIYPI
ncbi:aromatic-ring-hydroxylating dioxygenase subunit beta [Aquisediminimonas profunda]|uniref:aromatic-ring-hydroxylating dioxygenase subunit beta n=1 Tax=Aquisediminimonas profunda TaxID=1550733 RepID=UPI001C6325B4|nr:aromatic-ring-hydroxylating dioxygenase subunit beta [Aquisediminimonas profunda]